MLSTTGQATQIPQSSERIKSSTLVNEALTGLFWKIKSTLSEEGVAGDSASVFVVCS